MRFRHDKYPIPCARVHGAMVASSLSLRASAACFAHQNEQRPAAEFGLFDVGCDPAAVGSTVRITRIVPLSSLAAHPVGALQAASGASFGDHGSASEGFAGKANEALGLRFLAGHLAQQFQRRGGGRHQHQNIRAEA